MIPILRSKRGKERLRMVGDLFHCAREIVTLSARTAHPERTEAQAGCEVSRGISHGLIAGPI